MNMNSGRNGEMKDDGYGIRLSDVVLVTVCCSSDRLDCEMAVMSLVA